MTALPPGLSVAELKVLITQAWTEIFRLRAEEKQRTQPIAPAGAVCRGRNSTAQLAARPGRANQQKEVGEKAT